MEETKQMGFFEKVLKIFTSPTQVFTELKDNPKVLQPILFLIVLSILVVAISGPVNQIVQTKMLTLMSEKYGMNIPQTSVASGSSSIIIGAVFAPVGLLIGLLFISLLYWAFSKALKGKSTYKQVFCVAVYSSIITYVFSLISIALCLLMNTDVNPLSFGVLFPNGTYDSFVYDLLISITLYGIWAAIVSAIGLAVVNEFSKVKGYVITFSFYILGVLFSASAAMMPFLLQGMMRK